MAEASLVPSQPGSYSSPTINKILMQEARERLKGQWGIAIGVIVIFALISVAMGFVPCLGVIAQFLLAGPFALGLAMFFLKIARSQEVKVGVLFQGFNFFGNALGAYLLMLVFTILWTMLLIVPGIIAAISYSMTYYILQDEPTLGPLEAITRSKNMMMGNKWKYFCLSWRFFGWYLLALLTLGIGMLWVVPYFLTSRARFYEDLKANAA